MKTSLLLLAFAVIASCYAQEQRFEIYNECLTGLEKEKMEQNCNDHSGEAVKSVVDGKNILKDGNDDEKAALGCLYAKHELIKQEDGKWMVDTDGFAKFWGILKNRCGYGSDWLDKANAASSECCKGKKYDSEGEAAANIRNCLKSKEVK